MVIKDKFLVCLLHINYNLFSFLLREKLGLGGSELSFHYEI